MSRTSRNYPSWVDWLDGFDKKLERGQVSIPKREVLKGKRRLHGLDEVWGQLGKKLRKKLLTKKRRQAEKREMERDD